MSAIYDALPGLEVPVRDISRGFARMWAGNSARGEAAPATEDAKATQVNLVLHLGYQTTPEDAVAQFQTVVRFSRRYPSRTVVLCPLTEREDQGQRAQIQAKLYGECHLGETKHDTRCVEFVILRYPQSARGYLEDQVSTCLSTDLPLYYWAHRFSTSAKLADYRYLLGHAKRVIVDTSVAPADVMDYPWPHPKALRDLAYSRLLPVRQTIGQFLARYAPEDLARGLTQVGVRHGENLRAEGRALSGWLQRRLADCGANSAGFSTARGKLHQLDTSFAYQESRRSFHWTGDLAARHACWTADFGGGGVSMTGSASMLTPEDALSEAMFF